MVLILKNAHVVDPAAGIDEVIDVKVEDDRIAEVGHGLAHEGAEVRDLSGKYLVPGLVDIHVHFRDPGFEYKEDIETGTRAAAHGGFDVRRHSGVHEDSFAPVLDRGKQFAVVVDAGKERSGGVRDDHGDLDFRLWKGLLNRRAQLVNALAGEA